MASIVGQGAGCCGRRILTGMTGATVDSIRQDMGSFLAGNDDELNKIVEAVVSDENENRADIEAALVEVGFVQVAAWNNDSGSFCRMFLYAPNWTAFPNGAAVPIAPPPPPAPEPRPEPRIVLSTFHNVLRDGRSEAGWPTRDAAAAAAPRAQSIDRRDVYASGAVRWVTSV